MHWANQIKKDAETHACDPEEGPSNSVMDSSSVKWKVRLEKDHERNEIFKSWPEIWRGNIGAGNIFKKLKERRQGEDAIWELLWNSKD